MGIPGYTLIFTGICYILLGLGLGALSALGVFAEHSQPDAVVGVLFGW